jgi:cyclohexa-1,5-dienecarbonyl-CoA hydratase
LGTQLFDDQQSMIKGADAWVENNILPKSASSLRFALKAARTGFNQNLSANLDDLARFYTEELMKSHDANEGIKSFLEKRNPEWTNS